MDIIVFLIGCLSIIFMFLPHMFLASLLLGGVGTLVGILIIIIRIPITGTLMCFVSFLIILIVEILIPIYVHHVTPDFITFLFN